MSVFIQVNDHTLVNIVKKSSETIKDARDMNGYTLGKSHILAKVVTKALDNLKLFEGIKKLILEKSLIHVNIVESVLAN